MERYTYDLSGFILWWSEVVKGSVLTLEQQYNIDASFHKTN